MSDDAADKNNASSGMTLKIDSASEKVTVEVVHTTKGVPLQGLIALGMILLFTTGMAYYYISSDASSSGFDEGAGSSGNCGDGIDNDAGGQSDRDDPDCYANPELWEGYSSNRSETNSNNDPPDGQP